MCAISHCAVIFDLGGVVFDSPLHAVREFERNNGLLPLSIGRLIREAGPAGAWARLERGELSFNDFLACQQAEFDAAGVSLCTNELMDAVERALRLRPRMIEAVRSLRAGGFKAGALTNNWQPVNMTTNPFDGIEYEFDAFIQSYKAGRRKPEPEIYRLACERLAVRPGEAIFLDDIGENLKPARALGMTTIKVDHPDDALWALERVLRPAWRAPR